MWEEILNLALNNGIWAALFVSLMVYLLRDTGRREKKYQEIQALNEKIITGLSDDLRVVCEIETRVEDIGLTTKGIEKDVIAIRKDVGNIKDDLKEDKNEQNSGKVKKQKRLV
jgi:hypothetical protein